MMENLMNFFGRFHPLLVHLPIGILFLAFLFEALARFRRYRKLSVAIQPALFLGALSAIGSVITGYFLSQEGGYETATLTWHQNAGIATAVFTIVLYFLRRNQWILQAERNKRKPIRLLLFLPLMALLTITGHLGGSLTHGEEFLSEFASFDAQQPGDPVSKIKLITNVNEAILYHDVVQPILESRCYSCHSSKKQKGELRLDGTDLLLKGGKHGSVLTNGLADSSSLFTRLMLPLEDEHHMPPNEKPQLSSIEIDLIRLWINEGGQFEKKIKEFKDAEKVDQFIKLLVESSQRQTWIPTETVNPANEKAVQDLQADGALVLPMSVDNHYLSVSFINARDVTPQKLEHLLPLKDQLLFLRLSYANLTRQDLSILKQLSNLTWLYLDHSNVTDSCAQDIASLPKLKYLNLVGTEVTDHSIPYLANMKELKQVYFYQSKVTLQGIKELLPKLPKLEADTGHYMLPKLSSDTIIHKRKAI